MMQQATHTQSLKYSLLILCMALIVPTQKCYPRLQLEKDSIVIGLTAGFMQAWIEKRIMGDKKTEYPVLIRSILVIPSSISFYIFFYRDREINPHLDAKTGFLFACFSYLCFKHFFNRTTKKSIIKTEIERS